MVRVLLLLVALIGTTVAQLRFDSTGRPLFEVTTPPNLPPNSRSSLPIDHVDSNGVPLNLPQPIPVDQRLLPPLFSLSSTPQTASSRDSRQSIGTDGALRTAVPPQVQKLAPPASSPVKTPQTPAIGILPNARIRVEGFQPLDRRFATRKKRFIEDWTSESVDYVQEEQSDNNEFLPVVSSPRRLSDVESFDQSDSEVDNDVSSEGSGGSPAVSLTKSIVDRKSIVFPSSTSLHPESGYQEAATQIEQGISKSRLNSEIIFRIEQEEEERNSISDKIEGSALEDVKVTEGAEENVVSDSIFGWLFGVPRSRPAKEDSVGEDVEIDMQKNLEKDEDFIVQEKNTSPPTVDQPVVSTPASVSPNSVPLFRDSKLVRIVKDYAGFIVGTILGIPATVVLCYFIYLKRLKRYTGTLDVSPRPIIFNHKKSESRKAMCSTMSSEENELSCSPSASTSKTPPPPPFPTHYKKYVP